jgi:hypothetical protein
MTLDELVGRQLMFGLPGPDITDADIRLFEDTKAGGVMLYRRNFETPERLERLLGRLESALGRRLLIATDHEGGRIIMLGRAVTIFPDNLTAGTAGEVAFVHRQGIIEGRELRRLGVDVNFAPVLDVLTERYSPNIGIRSYGKDATLVARYGAARITGLQAAGVSACAKHFPGKGHAPVDAHLGLPVIESDWGEMHAVHLLPFMAAIEAGVDCLMTSHPLYPGLDPTPQTPATFSRLIVSEYLRGQRWAPSRSCARSAMRPSVRRRPGTICCSSAIRKWLSEPRTRRCCMPIARTSFHSERSSRAWPDSMRFRPSAPIVPTAVPRGPSVMARRSRRRWPPVPRRSSPLPRRAGGGA